MDARRVSYAGKRVYIGLDVHRSFFVASCVCDGLPVKRCRMPARGASVILLISKYFPDSEVSTCYEAGFSGFWLHRELEAAGISNKVVNAASLEVAANDRVKTDKRDSLKLATQLAAGRLKGIRVPSLEEEYRRLLPRTREQLSRAIRRAQNQVRMRLHQFGLLPADYLRVLRLKDAERFVEGLEGDLKFSLERLLRQWRCVLEERQTLERRMGEQAKHDPLETLYRSVPGIGILTSRVLSTELGDMSQFPNIRALYSFSGLTPSEYSSGEKVQRGCISRQGSSRLRYVLIEASWKAVRKDPVMKRFYEELKLRCGARKAIVATARKLLGKARAVVRDGKPYEANYREAV